MQLGCNQTQYQNGQELLVAVWFKMGVYHNHKGMCSPSYLQVQR